MSCWTGGHKVRLDHIWVTDLNGNTVTEIRPSDGDVFGKFAVGNQPQGIAYDGANIWVGNTADNTVTKLRASDGTVLGTFAPGTYPNYRAFDGDNIWATNGLLTGQNWQIALQELRRCT